MTDSEPKPEPADYYPRFVRLERGASYTWCACGRSQNQPFCDGSHEGSGIEPRPFVHDGRSGEFSLCACKHTLRPPFCDGAHRELMVQDAAEGSAAAMEQRFPAGKPDPSIPRTPGVIGPGIIDLPVKNAAAAIRYYADVLGFEKEFDDQIIGYDHTMYAGMTREGFHLTLDEHRAAEADNSVLIACEVADARALHDELVERGANIVVGMVDQVWQSREFVVEDLNGHRIRFFTNLAKNDIDSPAPEEAE